MLTYAADMGPEAAVANEHREGAPERFILRNFAQIQQGPSHDLKQAHKTGPIELLCFHHVHLILYCVEYRLYMFNFVSIYLPLLPRVSPQKSDRHRCHHKAMQPVSTSRRAPAYRVLPGPSDPSPAGIPPAKLAPIAPASDCTN